MQHAEILGLAGLRVDGRKWNELREIKQQFGVSSKCNGSIYFEQGLNKILVEVDGPREPLKRTDESEKGDLLVQIRNANFSGIDWKKRKTGDRFTSELEQVVMKSLEGVLMMELYKKSQIIVSIQILENDGSILPSIINACCLALMDAGLSMNDMIVSCSVGHVRDELVQDCNLREQNSGEAYMVVCMKGRSEEIIHLTLDSRLSADKLEEALEVAKDACKKLRTLMENRVKSHIYNYMGSIEDSL